MKSIVIYYSYGGNTRRVAQTVRQALDADVAEIKTVRPYEGSYNDVVDQGKREIDSGFMPQIEPLHIDFSQYDTVILGSPVWWYTFAPAMKTFLNQADLSGKTVYPFATNGGWIGHTFKDFKNMCKGAKVQEGLNVRFGEDVMQTSESSIQKWIKGIRG
ncbi:MAG: flavodoxin [bacterium]|nr:flavodoxin [bacterium]